VGVVEYFATRYVQVLPIENLITKEQQVDIDRT
jgi:hypothetical protein